MEMLKNRPRLLPLTLAISTLALSACNSNDDDGSAGAPTASSAALRSVTIVPSLGKISNGRVVLRNARNPADRRGGLGDSLPIRADGSVTFQVPANVPELLAELEPTNQTTYFDEGVADNPATPGVDESHPAFPLTQTLRVAFRQADLDAQGRVAMTALTEAAVSRALALAGAGSLADYIDAANAFIESVFKIASIHQVPVLLNDEADFRDRLIGASNAAARDYAMRLAALAKQARAANAGDPTPALSMMKALSDDLSRDNALDGKRDGVNIDGVPYDFNAFLTAWRQAMTQLVAAIQLALGEGGLTPGQLGQLTDLFNNLAGNLDIDRTPPVGEAVPLRIVNGIAEYACADRDRVKSLTSNSRLDIDFVNQSGKSVNIDWLNNFGVAVRYRTALASGSTYAQSSTYVTHPWLITDAAGQCQGIYVATTTTKKTITLNSNGVATLAEAGGGQPGGTCSSQGADNKIGFANAPDDFCGFTRAVSEILENQNTRTYSFRTADADIRYLVINFENGVLKNVLAESTKYSFGCGAFGQRACTGIVFQDGVNNKEFIFNNTVLDAQLGATQPLTLVSGSVIHPVVVNPNAPLRTENGVEFYDCATWKQIPNGGATSNVSLNFINQRGNFKSITIYGLNSINRSVLLFGNLQNGGTRTQAGLHNQMVMVDDSGGTCLAVLKPVTAGDKNVTFNADDSVSVSSVVAPPPAGVTITPNDNACSGGIPTLRQSCGVTTTNDFSINNLKTVNGGTACTLTKNGGNVTVNLNGKSITASLNAEAGDSLSVLAGGDRLIVANTSGTSVSYRINAAGTLVHSEVTSFTDAVIAERCTF